MNIEEMSLEELYTKETDKKCWTNPVCHGERTFYTDEYVLWLTNKVKELESEVNGIIPDKVQPCGCQLCFCEGERCNGCGAKLCQDKNCNVRKGILTYSQHPQIADLQQQLENSKCCGRGSNEKVE